MLWREPFAQDYRAACPRSVQQDKFSWVLQPWQISVNVSKCLLLIFAISLAQRDKQFTTQHGECWFRHQNFLKILFNHLCLSSQSSTPSSSLSHNLPHWYFFPLSNFNYLLSKLLLKPSAIHPFYFPAAQQSKNAFLCTCCSGGGREREREVEEGWREHWCMCVQSWWITLLVGSRTVNINTYNLVFLSL